MMRLENPYICHCQTGTITSCQTRGNDRTAEDTEIYSGDKIDICQPEHEGGNINESYTKCFKPSEQTSRGISRRASSFFSLAMRDP